MTNTDLTKALAECHEAARSGYKLASDEKAVLDGILKSAEDKISETAIEYKTSPCEVVGIGETLEEQLSGIQGAVDELRMSFAEDLQVLEGDLDKFSVTLFGRTMAGKSTLMEVLTEGDGSAIGLGAQRTTRDIRRYEWNGLAVTDVPGIGAFEGEEDTRLAFDAAKTADLIVFLLTDDAPQAVEADCFRQVKDLGKPVIVIMNVKVSVDAGKSMKLIERDMNRAFDEERIEDIRTQFCKFAEPYGQDWTGVPFVFAHLKAAYEAVKCEKSDDEETKAKAEFWRNISRIDNLKSLICEEVQVRGKYIRVKTFADIIANPMIEALSSFDYLSYRNEYQGKIIDDKKHALEKRKKNFVKGSKKRIESFMMQLKTELRTDIAIFAEDHYDDKMADIEWNKLIKSKNIEGRCKELLDEMEAEVDSFVAEAIRELTSELNYVSVETSGNFIIPAVFDVKGFVKWTNIALTLGGELASVVLLFTAASSAAGPVGLIVSLAGATVSAGIFVLESRGDKIAKARANLEKRLNESVNSACDNIWTQLEKNMDKLVSNKINLVLTELNNLETVIFALASTQLSLADSLRLELRSLNMTFTENIATAVFGKELASSYISKITTAARIPGVCTLYSEEAEGAVGGEFRLKIADLISEEVGFVTATPDTSMFVSGVLAGLVEPSNILCDEGSNIVTIKINSKDIRLNNKLRLLEQFVPYKKIGG